MPRTVFTSRNKKDMKFLYLSFRNPTEIAEELGLRAFPVHNYLQGMYKKWEFADAICPKCGIRGSKHLKCSKCERCVHDNYVVFHEKPFCEECVGPFR